MTDVVTNGTAATMSHNENAELAQDVLDGVHGLATIANAAAILADREAIGAVAEPLDGILSVVVIILEVWRALETP